MLKENQNQNQKIEHKQGNKNYSERFYKASVFQPFFADKVLQERMVHIRKNYIQPVREQYNEKQYKKNIKYFVDRVGSQVSLEKFHYYYWNDEPSIDKEFTLIKAVTNIDGNQQIAKLVNSVLRQDNYQKESLKLAVFLVEAINIQLFLLTKCKPELHNFKGTVYRGLAVGKQDFLKFMEIQNKDIQKRFISVPLSLWSSSKSQNVAFQFMKLRKDSLKVNILILMVFHVISLDEQDLKLYQKTFPSNIVSTICAVDISKDISQFEDQKEVLLRGVFANVLKIEEIEKKGVKYHKIHCVMVNANRDHISTNFLGEQADSARSMFACMAKKARLNFASTFQNESTEFKQEKIIFERQLKVIQQDFEIIKKRLIKMNKKE